MEPVERADGVDHDCVDTDQSRSRYRAPFRERAAADEQRHERDQRRLDSRRFNGTLEQDARLLGVGGAPYREYDRKPEYRAQHPVRDWRERDLERPGIRRAVRCPRCDSAMWKDNLVVGSGWSVVYRCFCGYCSRPDLVPASTAPRFMTSVVRK